MIAQTTFDLKLQTVCVCARHSAISEREKKSQSFTVGDFPIKKCRAIFKASKLQSEKNLTEIEIDQSAAALIRFVDFHNTLCAK